MLTSWDGKPIVYDDIGNPEQIGTDSDGAQLTWQGRQLMSYQTYSEMGPNMAYGQLVSFDYNADGIRTSKTIGGVEHKYYLDGSQIIAEMWTVNNVEYLLYYLYDETGTPIGIEYRTSNYGKTAFDRYYFEKNLQGDIIAVYRAVDGAKICSYTYNAWGECSVNIYTVSNLSDADTYIRNNNPFRYRGYYYDTETGLYYLQSRYYNPEWGRFLNADGYVSTGTGLLGYNMFAYCSNNPVMGYDPTGEWNWGKFWDGVVSVGAAVVGVVSGVIAGGSILATTGNVGAAVTGGIAAGSIATGVINNTVNAIYYEFSDGESDLTNDSYVENGYLTRWARLDYAKKQTEESHYNLNAWRYYSEYGLHMYAWLATGWADGKDILLISEIAKRSKKADVDKTEWDTHPEVLIPTIVLGIWGY